MKTRLQIGLVKLFLLSLLAVACKPEVIEPDPCEMITCEFGTCVDGSCQCDEYHTGVNCDELLIPAKVIAKTTELIYVPKACTAFDGGTGLDAIKSADVYVQIRQGAEIIYDTRDLFYKDSDCFGGCDFGRGITLDIDTQYQLRVYDRDTSTSDDLMGSFSFKPEDMLAGKDELNFSKWLMVVKDNACSNGNFSSSLPMRFSLIDLEYEF
ncbi:MAG: hypothetical protein AAFN10_04875 [Bacteroidota bacterium]